MHYWFVCTTANSKKPSNKLSVVYSESTELKEGLKLVIPTYSYQYCMNMHTLMKQKNRAKPCLFSLVFCKVKYSTYFVQYTTDYLGEQMCWMSYKGLVRSCSKSSLQAEAKTRI